MLREEASSISGQFQGLPAALSCLLPELKEFPLKMTFYPIWNILCLNRLPSKRKTLSPDERTMQHFTEDGITIEYAISSILVILLPITAPFLSL